MSRREGRDSDSRHHRSRFDREPSPKRSRRDGKPETERPASNSNLDAPEHSDRDQKHRRRLQGALPLEAPSVAPDPKTEIGDMSKESDKKTNGHREGTKHASDSTEAPRSRSSFQHDKRGNASQVGRSLSRRESTDGGWWKDSRDRQSERSRNRATANDSQLRDDKSHVQAEDNRSWRHDGYFKMEADSNPPARKRPSFREKKTPVDAEVVDKKSTEPSKPSHNDAPVVGSEKQEEKGKPVGDRPEKPLAGEREANQRDFRRGNFSSRDRYGGGGGSYGGRERFSGRQGQYQNRRPSGVPVEKWKHDLFDEANRSPPPKNEEEQIAKIEALLASS